MSLTPRLFETTDDVPLHLLTDAQESVWRAMLALQQASGGRPPTQGEVSASLGYKTKQGCVAHFEALSRKGFIVCAGAPGRWRSWMAVSRSTQSCAMDKPPRHKGSGTCFWCSMMWLS